MKLYYSTGTSGMSCVIAIKESAIACELIEVSFQRNVNLDPLKKVNPLGAVGTLVLDDGKVLTQNAAILQYIGGLNPKSGLLAAEGSWERMQTLSWLSYGVSDLYYSFVTFFRAEKMVTQETSQNELYTFAKGEVEEYLVPLETQLKTNPFVAGKHMSIADCYIFNILGFTEIAEIDLKKYPNVQAYMKRIAERPAVQQAQALEND